MIGVEFPWSSSLIFHLTFSLSDHFIGTSFSAQWPCPVGPRQAGQLSAGAAAAVATSRASVTAVRFIRVGLARLAIAVPLLYAAAARTPRLTERELHPPPPH